MRYKLGFWKRIAVFEEKEPLIDPEVVENIKIFQFVIFLDIFLLKFETLVR